MGTDAPSSVPPASAPRDRQERNRLPGVSPYGPTPRYSFGRRRSRGTDACGIRLAGVGYFRGHFIEPEKYT